MSERSEPHVEEVLTFRLAQLERELQRKNEVIGGLLDQIAQLQVSRALSSGRRRST